MFGSKLSREIVLHDDECQVMFASRLAKANGYHDLEEFCWMTSLSLSGLQAMNDETAGLLSAWSGVPATRLSKFALTGNNVTSFGATSVRRSQLEMATLRVCRHCLYQDMAAGHGRAVTRPYVRAAWRWMEAGDVFLTEVKERQVHTVRSATVEYQLTPDRVKNVIEKYGFTTTTPNGGVKAARVLMRQRTILM
ncbi:hypothetical protein PX860_01055 [Agrobacterium leguminum]|uniref:hypothetical protein n=1 Tax=Agrobacterium leguminum TaxID=2792015 RepID=UPI002729A6AB|nr:hypothetical protein [Agrobacterium leguminum]WLD97113.1 hypothetical protein PX860_01055 [Agrobacterium leguminum]